MPLASDRAGGINANIIAAPGPQPITPAINDLINAYRQGIVTNEDLMRTSGIEIPAAAAKAQQDIADQAVIRPLARQASVGALQGEIAIQPRKQELQQGQVEQGISALPTPEEQQASGAERLKSAQIRNALASSDSKVRLNAISQLSQEQVFDLWTAANGQPPPDHLEIPNASPVTPKPIDEFYLEHFGEHPAGTNARDNLNRPDVQAAYAKYVEEATHRPESVFKNDPRYFELLKRDLADKDLKEAIKGAQIKALPTVLEAQAKATAEAPVKQAAAQEKAQGDVLMELHKSEALKRFEPQFEAFQKVDAIRNSGKPPTNADDIAIMYEYVKLLDPTSAVREGEAKLAQSTTPAVRQLYNQFGALFTDHNKLFDAGSRASLFQAMDTLRAGAEKSIAPEIKRISAIAIDRGVPLDQVFTGPYQAILTKNPTAGNSAPSATGAVPQVGDIVTLKDGRRIKVKSVTATGIVPDETFVQ
jgi:hypothetical protein